MFRFTDELIQKVKHAIRQELSARHVPYIILETKDIPVKVKTVLFIVK